MRGLVTEVEPRTGLSGTWQIPATPYIEDHRVGGSWIRQGPQVKSCLGYAPEDGYTPNFWKTRLHPADRDRVLAEDERCDQTLEPFRSTYRVFARDGRTSGSVTKPSLSTTTAASPATGKGVCRHHRPHHGPA